MTIYIITEPARKILLDQLERAILSGAKNPVDTLKMTRVQLAGVAEYFMLQAEREFMEKGIFVAFGPPLVG